MADALNIIVPVVCSLAPGIISNLAAAAEQEHKDAKEKGKEETDGELEGVVTTQPTETVNEPPSPEEMIEGEVFVSGCCVACSIICICSLPLLMVAIPALILGILVRINYLEIAI